MSHAIQKFVKSPAVLIRWKAAPDHNSAAARRDDLGPTARTAQPEVVHGL
jgi:hypothetical protein